MANKFVQTYLREIEQIHARGNATEHSYRGALTTLIDALNPKVRAVNEPKRIKVGAPDYIISPAGQSETPLGYIEAKDIGVDLDGKDTQKQLARYVDGLGNVILTDYIEFRWYASDDRSSKGDAKNYRYAVTLAKVNGKKLVAEDADEKFVDLLGQFLSSTVSTVKSAKELAKRMANLAKIIRDIILNAINEGEIGQLIETRNSFREVLLHDMTDHQFADMYAQTISYGMFAARVNHTDKKKRFERMTAGYDLPKTNPFLRQLFNTIGGPELDERVTWTVDELANLLNHTDMEDILRDFGTRTRQEDPVVHFYETFLAAYDPKLRESRGVYYTPEPVVSYIVRSVDHILKTDFGLEKGLADSSKIQTPSPNPSRKREGNNSLQNNNSGKSSPLPLAGGAGGGVGDLHKVLILDPACGTGTFLHGVIDQIHDNFKGNDGAWSSYVSEHLLPRIFGFELLMAPYAVAHLKLGLQLKEFGYDFKSDERLRVYLTNTLEEAFTADERLPFSNFLAKEANAANEVKRDLPIMVVLGNPPYSGVSANMGVKITKIIEPYRFVDGKPLGERKLWLQDDYVKFIRFGQMKIDQNGEGILALITNHSYLDNPTFRGMRQSLIETFDSIYILDLHGNSKQAKSAPSGAKDENVFDIQQGVSIAIFIKQLRKQSKKQLFHHELWGEREESNSSGKTTGGKYPWLFQHDISNTEWQQLTPASPFYFYIPQNNQRKKETDRAVPILELMPKHGLGYQTSRDDLVMDFDRESLIKKIEKFLDPHLSDSEVRNLFFPGKNVRDYLPGDTRQWSLSNARNELRRRDWKEAITRTLYRPFDFRYCLYDEKMVDWPRPEMLGHLLVDNDQTKNVGLVIGRQGDATGSEEWDVAFVADEIFDQNVFRRGGGALFPLKLIVPNGNGSLFSADGERFNFSQPLLSSIGEKLGYSISSDKGRNRLTPRDVFAYSYAILNSHAYRSRFEVVLRRDFPSVPFTSKGDLFRQLCKLGEQLVSIHLMEKFGKQLTGFRGKGSDMVEYVKYDEETGRVQINPDQYFKGIPDAVWNFHIGGYQVAQKWLKDRKNRTLSYDDIEHYHHIISALAETMRLMKEIDEVIAEAGGFPLK